MRTLRSDGRWQPCRVAQQEQAEQEQCATEDYQRPATQPAAPLRFVCSLFEGGMDRPVFVSDVC
jgi:hypothetical protein